MLGPSMMAASSPFAIGYALNTARRSEEKVLGAIGLSMAIFASIPLFLIVLLAAVGILYALIS